jgi:hypothetical protein
MLDRREAWKDQQEVAQHQHRFYSGKRTSVEILQQHSQIPPAIYRFGVNIG